MLPVFVCMKVENARILFTHQDNWDHARRLQPEPSFYLPLLNVLTVSNHNWKMLEFSIKAAEIKNLVRIRVFHDNRSGAPRGSPLHCAQMSEREYYYMLFQQAIIIPIIVIYLTLFKKIHCTNPPPPRG